MAFFDLSFIELQTYDPPKTREPDFETFWLDTLAESARQPLNAHLSLMKLPYIGVWMYQATYAGWNGSEVVGTYALPAGDGPFPALVIYHGYSSSRPDPFELLSWTSQGYAVLAIDMRGQSGESSDGSNYPGGHAPGYLTLGISDPYQYYYRGAFVDAVRAVEFLAEQPEIDTARIGVTGCSQGGGLALAATALCAMRQTYRDANAPGVLATVAEIPFLCHFARAATLVDSQPYAEIASYCRKKGGDTSSVFRTLSYFDGMNLAEYIQAPTLVTVGLMDMVCPPSTVFAAYNAIPATKNIIVAHFGEHETFPGVPEARIRWFMRFFQ